VAPVGEAFCYRLEQPGVLPAGGWQAPTPLAEVELPVQATAPPADPPQEVPLDRPAAPCAYHQALELLERGDREGARWMLEELLKRDPEQVVARVTLGNLYLREHAFDAARAAYREARQRQPLMPEVYYLQGVVLRKLGLLERAEEAFRQALFLQPDFWCAALMLAGIHGRRGNSRLRRRFLVQTRSVLERRRPPRLYASYVKGIKDVDLNPGEVAKLCCRYLARMDAAVANPAAQSYWREDRR
jgi:tetratricopeptide (TPR) repeat protein